MKKINSLFKITRAAAGSVALFFVADRVFAGDASPGLIHMPGAQTGVFYFTTTGGRTNVPSCASSNPSRFALDTSTGAGRSVMAVVMMAYTSGKEIVVTGAGNCSLLSSSETVSSVVVND